MQGPTLSTMGHVESWGWDRVNPDPAEYGRGPQFSVVVATYGRGKLIEPTLASIAAQNWTDFEVLVVSDGPPADDLAETVATFGDRFRLLVLPDRNGSQAGPNRLGWAEASGRFIAYLGHDDVWHPDHLTTLFNAFAAVPEASFAVSGCIFGGPAGSESYWVTGLFDPSDRQAPRRCLFPPSSIAHLRELPDPVPAWGDPGTAKRPIDSQFLHDAAATGHVFAPTGRITVIKPNSAMRYLSYRFPTSGEQEVLLATVRDPAQFDAFVANAVATARRTNRYLTITHDDVDTKPVGEWPKYFAQVRGTAPVTVVPLTGTQRIEPGNDERALDWGPLEHGEFRGRTTWRWSGPSPSPRLMIPFTAGGPVHISVEVIAFADPALRHALTLHVNGKVTEHEWRQGADGSGVLSTTAPLRTDGPSVIEFRMPRTGEWLGRSDKTAVARRADRFITMVPYRWRSALSRRILTGPRRLQVLAQSAHDRVPVTVASQPRRVGFALAGISVSPANNSQPFYAAR